MHARNGASLIEVLLAIIIAVIACVGTLMYFAYGIGNINKQGNRRAALERAREQLEQVLSASASAFPASTDGTLRWCNNSPNPCTSSTSWVTAAPNQTVVVDGKTRRVEVTAQWRDDPAIGTPGFETLELGVKVWFMPGSTDDDFNRVHIKTLRTL